MDGWKNVDVNTYTRRHGEWHDTDMTLRAKGKERTWPRGSVGHNTSIGLVGTNHLPAGIPDDVQTMGAFGKKIGLLLPTRDVTLARVNSAVQDLGFVRQTDRVLGEYRPMAFEQEDASCGRQRVVQHAGGVYADPMVGSIQRSMEYMLGQMLQGHDLSDPFQGVIRMHHCWGGSPEIERVPTIYVQGTPDLAILSQDADAPDLCAGRWLDPFIRRARSVVRGLAFAEHLYEQMKADRGLGIMNGQPWIIRDTGDFRVPDQFNFCVAHGTPGVEVDKQYMAEILPDLDFHEATARRLMLTGPLKALRGRYHGLRFYKPGEDSPMCVLPVTE